MSEILPFYLHTFFFLALTFQLGEDGSFLQMNKILTNVIFIELIFTHSQLNPVPSALTSISFPSRPLRTCSLMNLALLSSSSRSAFFLLACSSWRRMVSGSRSMYWTYQPLGVSSTLQKPGRNIQRLISSYPFLSHCHSASLR